MKIILTENQYIKLIESQEVVDKLLDKISEKGFNSLSIDEKKYLDEFSKHTKSGGHPEEFIEPSERFHKNEGMIFTSSFEHIPEIKFIFDNIDEEDDEILIYGKIEYNGSEYIGLLVSDKYGNLVDIDFYDEDKVSETMNDEDGRFQNEIEGIEHEVYSFFEDDVISKIINNK